MADPAVAMDASVDSHPDAFERLVALHQRSVFALALRMTGNVEDAKDATQETFLRLHRNMGRMTEARPPGPWLYSVAMNACRDIGRARRRSRLVPMDAFVAGTARDPAASQEFEAELRTALQLLPEKERAALLLREMQGLSTEEVAKVLGSSEVTVRSQISSARLKMRKFFGRGEKRP